MDSNKIERIVPATLLQTEKKDAYKSALEIILALCGKMDYKTSDMTTIQTICETVLQKEV